MTNFTTKDEAKLAGIITRIRELHFPPSFSPELDENRMIKNMLSHQPHLRPKIKTILSHAKELVLLMQAKGITTHNCIIVYIF